MQLNIFYSTLKTSNITMRLRIGGFTLIGSKQWQQTVKNSIFHGKILGISKFNMADSLWQTEVDKLSDFDKIWFPRVLRDYEFALRFAKISKIFEEIFFKHPILIKFGIWGLLMSFIINLTTSLRNSRSSIEYGGQQAKNYWILMQIGTSGFLELLITNLLSYSWNFEGRSNMAK